MGAPGAVQKLDVGVDDLAVARQAHRDPPLHSVEEQGLVAILAGGLAHHLARYGHDVDLGLEARGQNLGGLGDLGRQHTVLDQEDIAVEAGALVPGAQVGDHPVDPHGFALPRKLPFEHQHVVELEEGSLLDRHPEFERGRRIGADDPANRWRSFR